jgi:glycosyl hydrolase family 2
MRRAIPSLAIIVGMYMAFPLAAADWKPAPGPLMTRWAKDVSPEKVHPEYPRPQMVRKEWVNLNGLWDYAIVDWAENLNVYRRPSAPWGKILVPFPIESSLSGVGKRVTDKQLLLYARKFKAPKLTDGGRLLLHFGAVDWEAVVSVNGTKVGEHHGGYDPFTFDITAALKPGDVEQELLVAVRDPTDASYQPRGKQVANPHGIWYTPVTGIWQTVWLEPVSARAIIGLRIVPNLDDSSVMVQADFLLSGQHQVKVEVLDGDQVVAQAEGESEIAKGPVGGPPMNIAIKNPKLWTPDAPFLYGLRVSLSWRGKLYDTVDSYFAMRKISLGKDEQGDLRLLLNNKPLFQFGPLDQGWWPDGLYTTPTDEALRYDIELTKKLGFNMIRKHVKVEPARWYYHCDKLGMLVWQDMPSGDKHARWDPVGTHNGTEMTRSDESAKNYDAEWKAIIDGLRNHPCIVMWVPFNEGWGQADTVRVTEWTKKYDPTRLVNCASGGNDFPVGDVYDIHRYPGPAAPQPDGQRAIVLGEYGGLGLPLEGHTWLAKGNWGYRTFQTKEELQSAYLRLIDQLRPLVGKGLSAAIYTQTTDVEIEVNGLMTYDRQVVKFDAEKLAAAHKKLYLPPPKISVVVPTSREEGQTWRFTTAKPADGWERPVLDSTAWKEAPGGFGEKSTPGSVVRTEWKTPDIWLRRAVEIPADKTSSLGIAIHYDEDSEIYLNGILIGKTVGYTTDYTTISIDDDVLKRALSAAATKDGKHTLAVHCHQTGGGQYIDVGLVQIVEQK